MSPDNSSDVPVSSLLTLVINTSPTPSAPGTELLHTILQSFKKHCPSLLACRVIVVLDHYDKIVPQARLKKGYVTAEQARDYQLYKENVKMLVFEEFCPDQESHPRIDGEDEAEYGSPMVEGNIVEFHTSATEDKRVVFIEPSRRLGFGLAVRSALRITETPYVWIQQHDWTLVHDIPLAALLDVMSNSETEVDAPVKYLTFTAVRMLSYAVSSEVVKFPVLKQLTESFKRDFVSARNPEEKIPLTPMFFWHDKPHIASTQHYLRQVYPTRLAMLRGDFIEDKIGQQARKQMKQRVFSKWATWLYYPNDGKQLYLRHLQGRKFRGAEAEKQKIAEWRQRNEHESVLRKTRAMRLTEVEEDDLYGLNFSAP